MSGRAQKLFFRWSILFIWLILFHESLPGRTAWISQMFIFETFQQWFPYKEFIAHCYSSGFFPLWTHNLECGFPFASFPHTGSFNIFNILFILLDYAAAISLSSLLHGLILSYASYLCGRELGFSRPASWMAALTFSLSGLAFVSAGSIPLHSTLCWLPLVFLFSLRLARKARLLNLAGLILVSLIQISSGDFEQIVYQDFVILIFLVFVGRVSLKNIFLWFLAMLGSWLAASVSVLPFINLLQNSYRQFATASEPAVSPLLYLAFPLGLLGPFETTYQNWLIPSPFYLGFMFILGLVLAWKNPGSRREIKVLLIFGALGLLYLVNPWPLSEIGFLQIIPADARYKMLGPFQFWMIMAAGAGINHLFQAPWTKTIIRPAKNFILAFGIWTAVLVLTFILLKNKVPVLSSTPLISARVAFACIAIVAALLLGVISKKESMKSLFLPLMAFLLLADLFLCAFAVRPRQSPQPFIERPAGAGFLQDQDPTSRIHYVSFLSDDQDMWRYHSLFKGPGYIHSDIRLGLRFTTPLLFQISGGDFNLMLIKNISADTKPVLDMLGVRHVVSRAPFFWGINPRPLKRDIRFLKSSLVAPGEEIRLLTDLFPGDSLRFRASTPEHIKPPQNRLKAHVSLGGRKQELSLQPELESIPLDIPSAQYGEIIFENPVTGGAPGPVSISEASLQNPSRPYQLVYQDELEIYENRTAWPRYFVSEKDGSHPDPEADLPKVLRYNPDEVELEVSLQRNGTLEVIDSYYPGWRAFSDQEELKIFRNNQAFQAVNLTEGHHNLLLSYQPLDFRIGLWFSIASLVALGFVFILYSTGLFGQCLSENKRLPI